MCKAYWLLQEFVVVSGIRTQDVRYLHAVLPKLCRQCSIYSKWKAQRQNAIKVNAFCRLEECLNNCTKPRNIRGLIMKVPETDSLFTLRTKPVKFRRGIQCTDKYFILPSTGFLFLVIHMFAFNKIHLL
jgi:hypothetical protein